MTEVRVQPSSYCPPGQTTMIEPAALLRLMRRRVPPEKRQRTEMSCDWCKKKRCKCLRGSTADTCRACNEIGRPCTTTEPRKRRVYSSISAPSGGAAGGVGGADGVLDGPALAAALCVAQQQQQQQQQKQQQQQQQPSPGPSPPGAVHGYQAAMAMSASSASITIGGSTDETLVKQEITVATGPQQQQQAEQRRRKKRMGRDGSKPVPTTLVPANASANATTAATAATAAGRPSLCDEHFFEDALGLPRHLGPVGSHTLLVKLREAMMPVPTAAMVMPNSAAPMSDTMSGALPGAAPGAGALSTDALLLPPSDVADALIGLFFERAHGDCPVLRRSAFQASYDAMRATSSSPSSPAEPAWLMCLCMVFVLGAEVADSSMTSASPSCPPSLSSPSPLSPTSLPTSRCSFSASAPTIPRAQLQARYLAKARELLPDVLLGGPTLAHVQALLLYARFLHVTRSRDASWNLTGAAIRMAVAMGLHRSSSSSIGHNTTTNPAERELRRRVWWSLHAFERIECSLLGRASAIDDSECSVDTTAQADLMVILGSVCKHQSGSSSSSAGGGDDEEPVLASPAIRRSGTQNGTTAPTPPASTSSSASSPSHNTDTIGAHVSFAAATAQALDLWLVGLPDHLRLHPDGSSPHARATLLLHLQYHYTVTLLCRPFLLALAASKMSPSEPSATGRCPPLPLRLSSPAWSPIRMYARRCVDSAKAAAGLLDRLFSAGQFSPKTGWDVHLVEATCLALAAGRLSDDKDLCADLQIVAALHSCVHILQSCHEFSLTTQSIAAATQEFVRALLRDERADLGANKADGDNEYDNADEDANEDENEGDNNNNDNDDDDDDEDKDDDDRRDPDCEQDGTQMPQRMLQQQQQQQSSIKQRPSSLYAKPPPSQPPRQSRQPRQGPPAHRAQQTQQAQPLSMPQAFAQPDVLTQLALPDCQPQQAYYYSEQQHHHYQQQLYHSQELDDMVDVADMTADLTTATVSTSGSQSGSSPDHSYMPAVSGHMYAHDLSSDMFHDPSMPWNLTGISVLGDWPEPDQWWQ